MFSTSLSEVPRARKTVSGPVAAPKNQRIFTRKSINSRGMLGALTLGPGTWDGPSKWYPSSVTQVYIYIRIYTHIICIYIYMINKRTYHSMNNILYDYVCIYVYLYICIYVYMIVYVYMMCFGVFHRF